MLTPTFKVLTQPVTEPVQIGDLQSQLNADLIDDGGKYTRILKAAREIFESHSGVSLLPTVWRGYLDGFPGELTPIKLMRGPVTAIASITYIDAAGDSTALATYQSDIKRTPARILPTYGSSWPDVRSSTLNTVTIEFTAGFASASVVPNKAVQAILMLAGYWVENPTMMGQIGAEVTMAYWSLVDAVHWEVFDE